MVGKISVNSREQCVEFLVELFFQFAAGSQFVLGGCGFKLLAYGFGAHCADLRDAPLEAMSGFPKLLTFTLGHCAGDVVAI